jgi:ribosomal protein S18 acetylase RimI-like enzyme
MQYISTRSLVDFNVVIDELRGELGERFPHSIENWCGIGIRPYPLPVWVVYLVTSPDGCPIGVCSYYKQIDDPSERFWIGWIGVRPKFRRLKMASKMLAHVVAELSGVGAKSISVYTSNPAAVALYQSIGMSIEGIFASMGLEQAAATGDELLLTIRPAEKVPDKHS